MENWAQNVLTNSVHPVSLSEDHNPNQIIRHTAPLSEEARKILMSSSNREELRTIFLCKGVLNLDRQLLFVQQPDVTVKGALAFLGW
jgi:hypothetical protein